MMELHGGRMREPASATLQSRLQLFEPLFMALEVKSHIFALLVRIGKRHASDIADHRGQVKKYF